MTQCSTSETDAPLYNSSSLPIQVMTTGPLPAHSKCKSGRFNVPRVMKRKFSATVMFFGGVSSEGHIMPPHIFKVGRKSISKCTWTCWRVWWSPGAIRWPVADPGCGSRNRPLLLRPEPAGLLHLVIRWEHHQHDLPQHQSQPSAEYSPSSRRRLWKRYAPSSGSVPRRWLRLKAATLSRCQLYFIIKLPELIFSIKVLK